MYVSVCVDQHFMLRWFDYCLRAILVEAQARHQLLQSDLTSTCSRSWHAQRSQNKGNSPQMCNSPNSCFDIPEGNEDSHNNMYA